MAHFDTTDRSGLAEDEYFRRKDAENLHRARGAERVRLPVGGAGPPRLSLQQVEAQVKSHSRPG